MFNGSSNALLLSFLFVLVLAGCAPFQRPISSEGYNGLHDLEKKGQDSFGSIPSVVRIPLRKDTYVIQEPLLSIPPNLDRIVKADFNAAEIEQILYAVAVMHGISVVYQPALIPQSQVALEHKQTLNQSGVAPGQLFGGPFQEKAQYSAATALTRRKPVSINFNGKLSDFLKSLSKVSGYFIFYENGAIVVREADSFNLPVPAYADIFKEIENSLKSLGATSVAFDKFSSSISFVADSNTLARIRDYARLLRDNALFVTLRIMLLNVTFNEEQNRGIDWSKVVFGYKGQSITNFGNKAQSSGNGSTTSSTGSTGSLPGGILPSTGYGYNGTATGANLFIEGADFSLNLLVNFLENYGKSELLQDVFAGAMSGSPGHLDSLNTTPFISEISFQSLSQVTTPSQAFKTGSTSTGVVMDFTPYYSSAGGTLTMPLKITASSSTLVTLQGGSQIGSITQPAVSQKKIETVLFMTPGQVAVIGGLVHEQSDLNGNGLPGESVVTKSYSKRKQKEELIAVVKPTIYLFEY